VVSRPLVAQLCGLFACADKRRKLGMQMDSNVAKHTLTWEKDGKNKKWTGTFSSVFSRLFVSNQ